MRSGPNYGGCATPCSSRPAAGPRKRIHRRRNWCQLSIVSLAALSCIFASRMSSPVSEPELGITRGLRKATQTSQVSVHLRNVMRRTKTSAVESGSREDSASGCPISRAKNMLSTSIRTVVPQTKSVAGIEGLVPIPGPRGLPADLLENSYHVMKIPIYGIEEATLRYKLVSLLLGIPRYSRIETI